MGRPRCPYRRPYNISNPFLRVIPVKPPRRSGYRRTMYPRTRAISRTLSSLLATLINLHRETMILDRMDSLTRPSRHYDEARGFPMFALHVNETGFFFSRSFVDLASNFVGCLIDGVCIWV